MAKQGTLGTAVSQSSDFTNLDTSTYKGVVVYKVSPVEDIDFCSFTISCTNLGDLVDVKIVITGDDLSSMITQINGEDVVQGYTINRADYLEGLVPLKLPGHVYIRSGNLCSPGESIILYASTDDVTCRVEGLEQRNV